MSLTSYRAAPPRANFVSLRAQTKTPLRDSLDSGIFNIVNGLHFPPPAKPGDDLLFHCLSSSTIGAVRFHGRVRDGIGWVTDAMATKLWGQRMQGFFDAKASFHRPSQSVLSMMAGFSGANRAIRTG